MADKARYIAWRREKPYRWMVTLGNDEPDHAIDLVRAQLAAESIALLDATDRRGFTVEVALIRDGVADRWLFDFEFDENRRHSVLRKTHEKGATGRLQFVDHCGIFPFASTVAGFKS